MAAIKQHLWAEWREQRSNLLGLWAGLLLLILAAQFVGADLYLRDPIAPVLFGALGYLAFTLAVLPRVFGGKSLAGCRGFLARSPSGLDSAFLGKVLFVNLGMAATALVPCGVAAVLIYFRAPVNFRRMFLGHSGFETFAIPLIAVHALPLVLVSWRLQLRWALVGIAMAAVLMFGAVKGTYLGTLDPSKHRFSSEFLLYASLGLILAPWVLAWGSFRRPENEAPQRHLLRSFGLLIVGLSPAWGMGLVSFAKHEFEVRRVVPRSLGFEVHSAFLTPDNRSVFFSGGLRKVDWQGDRSVELYTFSLDMQTLAARNLAEGRVMAETEVGLAYRGTGTFPNASGLVLHRYRPEDPAIQFHIDMETGELVPQEPTVLAWRNATRAAAMGLSTEFAIFHDYVGLGTLARNIIGDVPEWALFDPAGKHTYFEKDLPFTIAPYDFTLRVLPGKWLVSPQCKEGEWTTYDPYTGVLAPETGLQSKTGLFMALPDGRVLAKDNRS
ncbi:MAG: hypothetical protein GY930_12855, partial [bacterium]|nr:hypothetical protein [bacterium]